uniref:DUF1758 domain-containing protein n=1 Tax=Anopheles minimus TaxID=112268 RepID=A0A182W7W8_9DIPT
MTERQQIVKTNALCYNCLAKNHRSMFCRSSMRCGNCKGRHHTLMCSRIVTPSTNREETITATTHVEAAKEQMIWLSTAQVLVCSEDGEEMPARALLDQGSQSNFISERLVQLLRLRKRRLARPLSGIGAVAVKAESVVTAIVRSRIADFTATLQCLVLPKVTADFPFRTRDTVKWNIPVGVTLADPTFFKSERIDMLIGAELFAELLKHGQIRIAHHLPKLLETRLGWIVSGPQLMLSILHQEFWIIGARSVVKKVFNQCIRCFRCKPKPTEQPMGDLPKCRVSEAKPFAVSGVDYCGP